MQKSVPQHETPAELRLLYQISVNDIEHGKRRQWTAVYYVLFAFAAIVGLYVLIQKPCYNLRPHLKLLFLLPAVGVNFFGMWIIMDTHRSMCWYRARMKKVVEKFTLTAQRIYTISEGYPSFDNYLRSMVWPFIGLLTAGLFFVAWFLFQKHWYLALSSVPLIDYFWYKFLYWYCTKELQKNIEKLEWPCKREC